MKKVKGIIFLNKSHGEWELKLFDQKRILSECLEQWHKSDDAINIELDFEIKSKFQFKTKSQLGYIHASIKPTIISWAISHGDERKQEEIWDSINVAVDFIEERRSLVDEKPYMAIKSLAEASKEEVMEFIDKVLRWAGEWGIVIESPEEYKKRRGIKDWE